MDDTHADFFLELERPSSDGTHIIPFRTASRSLSESNNTRSGARPVFGHRTFGSALYSRSFCMHCKNAKMMIEKRVRHSGNFSNRPQRQADAKHRFAVLRRTRIAKFFAKMNISGVSPTRTFGFARPSLRRIVAALKLRLGPPTGRYDAFRNV
jgi:hypothetical protein